MNIVVCIKQVPDVDDIKWTKENNLDRSAMLSKINQYDEWALNHVLNIKHKHGCAVYVTVISMGPMQAKEILEFALAKGADRAILLSDKKFSASDTLATSKIIARAIEKCVDDFSVVVTGQMAQDGDTAQVPVSLAQLLGIIDVTGVIKVANADTKDVIVVQELENSTNLLEVATPCLLAIKASCPYQPRPKISDYIRAQQKQIEVYNADDLDLSADDIGIVGSPTTVYRAFRPNIDKKTIEVKENIVDEIMKSMLEVNS